MSHEHHHATINIDTATVLKTILLLLLFYFLYLFKELVLVVLTAVVLASAIEPAAKWFVRHRVPRIIAVLVVYVLVAVFFLGIFYAFIPVLLNESANFLSSLPYYINSLNLSEQISGSSLLEPSRAVVGEFSLRGAISELQEAISSVSGGVVSTVSLVFGGILSFIFIIVFSFYFAAQETGIDDFLRVITPLKHQKYILDLWKRSQVKIGRWMQGQLILAFIIGVLVYLGLTVLGVKYALLLAVVAGVFELIPVFGPVLSAIPAVAIAFASGGLQLALFVVGLYLIIQQFENHLIYPLVVTKVVGVPPMLVILALIVGAQLAGFLGIILSVPAATIVQELVSDLQRERARYLKNNNHGAA